MEIACGEFASTRSRLSVGCFRVHGSLWPTRHMCFVDPEQMLDCLSWLLRGSSAGTTDGASGGRFLVSQGLEIDRWTVTEPAVMRSLYWSVVVKERSRKATLSIDHSIRVPSLTYGPEVWVTTERMRSTLSSLLILKRLETAQAIAHTLMCKRKLVQSYNCTHPLTVSQACQIFQLVPLKYTSYIGTHYWGITMYSFLHYLLQFCASQSIVCWLIVYSGSGYNWIITVRLHSP